MRWWAGPDPNEKPSPPPTAAPDPRGAMLKWFAFGHLRPDLQEVSRPFADMAVFMVRVLPPGSEATMALRKLLEAKDCAVRAVALGPVDGGQTVEEAIANLMGAIAVEKPRDMESIANEDDIG